MAAADNSIDGDRGHTEQRWAKASPHHFTRNREASRVFGITSAWSRLIAAFRTAIWWSFLRIENAAAQKFSLAREKPHT
jgi:hypothetical protein